MAQYESIRGITDYDLPGEDGYLMPKQEFDVIYNSFCKLLICHVNVEKQAFLVKKIWEQSKIALKFVHEYEFVLNEMRFEMRKVYNRSKFTEQEILIQWTKMIIVRLGDDAGLDFYNLMLKLRADRVMPQAGL